MNNQDAARYLFALATLLEMHGANPYRIRAYRNAAVGLLRLNRPAAEAVNADGELDLPGLGPSLRRKLGELVSQGRMQFYDEVLAEVPRPLRDLLAVPGIGPVTAIRLAQDIGIRSVGGVVRAARRHRLQRLRGIGPRREEQLGAAAEALLRTAA